MRAMLGAAVLVCGAVVGLPAPVVSPAGAAGSVSDRAVTRLHADFDGDGFGDLAVGVPFEAVGSEERAGAVNVLYGTPFGLTGTGSQLFTQDHPGIGSTAEAFDGLGEALAVGDFDGDGYSDLAVGAPDERVGNVESAGAVNVLYGSPTGLTGSGSQLFVQDTAGIGSSSELGDRFGAALVAGDFDNNGLDDLAIGAPFETVGNVESAGAINVLHGSKAGLTGLGSQLFTQDSPGVRSTVEAFDRFGEALGTGDYDADGVDDLAVGAPVETVGTIAEAGAINVLFGTTAGLSGQRSQLLTQDSPGVGSRVEELDRFGAVLATGDFDEDGVDDLAVGVPFETVGQVFFAGALNVLFGTPALGLGGAGSQLFTQANAGVGVPAGEEDLFGRALAATDIDGDGGADLAIGAPFQDVGAARSAGAVTVLIGTSAGLDPARGQRFSQDTTGVEDVPEDGDSLAFALAGGDFDGDGFDDLGIGVPSEDVGTIADAGALNVIDGSADGPVTTGSPLLTQDTPGVGSTAEAFDGFARELAGREHPGPGNG